MDIIITGTGTRVQMSQSVFIYGINYLNEGALILNFIFYLKS